MGCGNVRKGRFHRRGGGSGGRWDAGEAAEAKERRHAGRRREAAGEEAAFCGVGNVGQPGRGKQESFFRKTVSENLLQLIGDLK